jgi:hypothetical protein
MNRPSNDYVATQMEDGFKIEFNDSLKTPIKVTFDDLQGFVKKFNENVATGKQLTLTEDEEVMLTLWQMLLIPEHTKH